MKLKTRILLVAASMLITASPAWAQTDARAYMQQIDNGSELHLQMLSAIAEGITLANVQVAIRKQPPLFCPPQEMVFTNDQYAEIARQYLKKRPQMGVYPVGLVMVRALVLTFPCGAVR